MRKRIWALSLPLWLVSCADTVQYIAPDPEPDPVVVPTYQDVLSQWESQLRSLDFVDPVESVPTNSNDPDYDNFIQNQEFKEGRTISLVWEADQVTVTNTQADRGVDITVSGGYVEVRNLESEAGADDARGKVTYRLSGEGVGQFKIYSNKKFQLVLDQLSLTCPDGPAISIQEKKRCFITLADGSLSQLADQEQYASDTQPTAEDEKGCLFSEGQLIFGGRGELRVLGRHQHGIASDEYVRIHPGCVIQVEAVRDGIHAKQQYHQTGSIVRSYALRDAVQSDSLGIQITGGYLYLAGQRCLTADGGGQILISEPARTACVNMP